MVIISKYAKIFLVLALILLCIDLIIIFAFTPQDITQGIIQKIFYIHVPSAFCMYIGFFLGALYSVVYLINRSDKNDLIAYCSIEVGFVFACCVLVSGPIWAKGTWGKFWDFDPRLTATLVVWFIFFSYLLIRKYYGNSSKGKLFSAVIAIIGILDVPIIHFSVKLWRGIHPNVIGKKASSGGLPKEMAYTFIFSIITFIVIYFYMFLTRLTREIKLQKERI